MKKQSLIILFVVLAAVTLWYIFGYKRLPPAKTPVPGSIEEKNPIVKEVDRITNLGTKKIGRSGDI
jgi:hypothetical protein